MQKGNYKHGMRQTRFWRIWRDMKTRCNNKKYKQSKDYSGRGIKLDPQWNSFENFMQDMLISYGRHSIRFGESNTFLERVNNDGNYEVTNCMWATREQQNSNRRMQKLSEQAIKEIREKYKWGNGRMLASFYKVTPAVISEVVNKKRNYANY